jgi:SSS family solute:Na+ symporter
MLCMVTGVAPAQTEQTRGEVPDGAAALSWDELPPLPDTLGLGGAFAGVHDGVLIVAGGANFPDGPPWEDGVKIWHDDVYVLPRPDADWRRDWKLDRPLAYGATVSIDEGVLLIGGCDSTATYADVSLLSWDGEAISRAPVAPLPHPSSFLAAALVGDTVYVAAGGDASDPTSLARKFWSMDTSGPIDSWSWDELPPWPGPARRKAVMAAQSSGNAGTSVYLFSGERPVERDHELTYEYLADIYRYDPSDRTWTQLRDLPRPVAAVSAVEHGASHILVFGGVTSANLHLPTAERPLFTSDVLAYHTITDTWVRVGESLEGVVTTTAVWWGDAIVLPSGEIRPGVRTPAVQRGRPVSHEASFGLLNGAVIVAYLVLLVALGIYLGRRDRRTDDYFLAGRGIPWWAAGISIYATQLSAITFIATPGLFYSSNWLVAPSCIVVLAVAPFVVYFYLPFFRRLRITTAYEYLERRFSYPVRLIGCASFVAFQLGRMAIVVYLPALALQAVTGLSVYACIAAMGVLATVYTVLGGMRAVIWTDVLQTFVLLFGLLFALTLLLVDGGGVRATYSEAWQLGKFQSFEWSWSVTELTTWVVMIGLFTTQIAPYTSDQAVIQRYLTTKDERAAARGIWLNGLLSIPFLLLFYLVGTGLWVYFRGHPEEVIVGMPSDQAFPLYMARRMPPGLSGLVIAGVFAAAMSTLDSGMHSIATSLTTDVIGRLRRLEDRVRLRIARWVTLAAGVLGTIIACLLAGAEIRSLFDFFQQIVGLLASGLVAFFMLGIFTKRANSVGAISGALVSAVVLYVVSTRDLVHPYLYAVIGISVALVVGYLVSLITGGMGRSSDGLTIFAPPSRDAGTEGMTR